ncbi:MAG: hypothetical protein BGO67_09845 [Alphaproteobacteria bacterium 41-28]|nr:MAG: hypothetical protein BGO67_09845 [Alphaproteobacteria bacterium 41-28]
MEQKKKVIPLETTLIEPEDLAQRWKITTITLAQWRWNGKGPRSIKIGRNTFYRPKDIEAFEEQKAKHSTTNTSDEDFFEVIMENENKNRGRNKR